MSTIPTLPRVLALLGLATFSAPGAFVIEANGTLGTANFAYTGDGTAASTSTTSSGNLPATTDTPPTFFTLAHVFGGNGTTFDEYTFSYTPDTDGDNVGFNPGDVYNLQQGLSSTGLSGGGAGIYNVYRIHPANPGVSGGDTLYEIFVNGGFQADQTVDQNFASIPTGQGVGRWELIGSVDVPNATDTVTVTMTPTVDPDGFVSMRASGIMFEYVAPIPEPGAVVLVGLGWALLGLRRRR